MGIISKAKISVLKKKLLREEKRLIAREKLNKKKKEVKQLEIELIKRIKKAKEGGLTSGQIDLLKKRKAHIEKQKRILKKKAEELLVGTGQFLKTFAKGIDRSIKEAEKRSKQSKRKKKK